MILHTINKPAALTLCEHLIRDDDLVVLIEEGAYLAGHEIPGQVSVIGSDMSARGLGDTAKEIQRIDYAAFVAMCASADKICSWF
ncbi:MAG: hypothetical protein ISP91_00240 [Pseudomonadales bacterium]|nr:hypothetical protein [Pseudomonadales bacterium]